jgi:hypothetical protein
MSQNPNDRASLLDPLGMMDVWKQTRDANLEAWAKFMTDIVNSDEYSQATGTALAQSLALSQPFRQTLERLMTSSLQALNMPSRTELTTLAERAVNIEFRLDDLDLKVSANQKVLLAALKGIVEATVRETVEAVVREAVQEVVKDAVRQAMTTPTRHLRGIEAHLAALDAKIAALQAPVAPAPVTEKGQEG